jgi:hypothetical protein
MVWDTAWAAFSQAHLVTLSARQSRSWNKNDPSFFDDMSQVSFEKFPIPTKNQHSSEGPIKGKEFSCFAGISGWRWFIAISATRTCGRQCDQIRPIFASWASFCLLGEFLPLRRIFASWAIAYFGQFFWKKPNFWATLGSGVLLLAYIVAKSHISLTHCFNLWGNWFVLDWRHRKKSGYFFPR